MKIIFFIASFVGWNILLLPLELAFTMPDKMYEHIEYQAVIESAESRKIKLYKQNRALGLGWIKTPDLELGDKNASSLCFFNNRGVPTLAVGTREGHILLWHWDSRKWVLTSSWRAHEDSISKITYSAQGKKRILTIFSEQSTGKNSVKTWLL